jgi:hypothetical protein
MAEGVDMRARVAGAEHQLGHEPKIHAVVAHDREIALVSLP